jgi:diguanylate cyclase (GGDEF)-like protein/PAS domain S-box-containing protein
MSRDTLPLATCADSSLRALFAATPAAHFVFGPARLRWANPAAEELTGYPLPELLDEPFWALAAPELADEVERTELRRLASGAGPDRYETQLRRKDGELRWIEVAARRIDWEGSPAVLATALDVTQRHRAAVVLKEREEALSQEEERAQVTLGSIGDGVLRTDESGAIDYLNPAAETITGWATPEALGRPLHEVFRVVDPVRREPITGVVARCLRDGKAISSPGKDLLIRRDGSEVEIRHTTALVRDREERMRGAVVVLRDLTELRTVEREMLYLATHDGLTGLYNRTEFERRLGRALASARDEDRAHALCYLDLDGFKLINDTCGHLAGDGMLGQIASLLKCRLRETDALGRLGGDEFGVLLENCAPPRALEVARDLCSEIRAFRFTWEENTFTVGASIGVVALGPGSGGVAQVLSAADAACYVAKERGGNRIQEYRADDSDLAERHGQVQLVQTIQTALEKGAWELDSQVVRPLAAGVHEPLFYEVLLRMIDRDGQRVPPAAFIPVAERHRLASAIDRWVVEAGLSLLARRETGLAGREVSLAINLSGQSLADESFLEFVAELLGASGIAGRLLFEITETASISHLGRATQFISTLRGKGCRFVLDDFGSGLSSFGYLRNLPVDFLKIDGQFVRRLTRDPIRHALVESINHIGHVMQLKTIAEAVEDEETWEALARMRVDYAQGFWIARPKPLLVPKRARQEAGVR